MKEKLLPGIGILICFLVGLLLNWLSPLNYYLPTIGIIITFFIFRSFFPSLIGSSGEGKWWHWVIIILTTIIFISIAYYSSATNFY